jgi:Uma2 family endonuclease
MPDPAANRGLPGDPSLGVISPAFLDVAGDSEYPVLFRGVSWGDYEAMLRIRDGAGRRFRITYDQGLMEVEFPSCREVFSGVAWDDYEAMLRIVGDRPIRIIYDRGEMEVEMPSQKHELYSRLLGRLAEEVALGLGLDYQALGMTTWRRRDMGRGLEPDQCYYIQHEAVVRQKGTIDLAVDPPPDLAIEVDITHSSLDRLEVYAQLRIPEVWRFDGTALTIYVLSAEGAYAPSATSSCLPGLTADTIVRLVECGRTLPTSQWVRMIREFVDNHLARQPRPGGPDVAEQA